MKTNYKQRIKDFFRKEGFYVVLFLCICMVATVTAISYKQSKSNSVDTNAPIEDNDENDELSLNMEGNSKTNEMQNAEIAKDNKNGNSKEENKKDTNESKATSAQVKLQYENPVDGKIIRGYTYPKPVMMDETNQRTIRGVDIQAKIGTNIKAAEDGIVEKIENTGVEDGMTIIIAHANGIKTKNTKLNENVNVKASDTVK